MSGNLRPGSFDQTLKLLMLIGAVGSFVWSVFVWDTNQEALRVSQDNESKRLATTRRIEATKPFLNLQLELYQEAVRLASVISTSDNSAARDEDIKKLMRLYWGKLALVENKEVEGAMVELRTAIIAENPDKVLIQKATLKLARACRISLDRSWGINAWTKPDDASQS